MQPNAQPHARTPLGEPEPAVRAAERLVLASIGAPTESPTPPAQELPTLALVGAAIARAAHLAAADARALPATAGARGFVWRLHPAPAHAGAAVAPVPAPSTGGATR